MPSDAAASVPSFAKPIYDHVTNVAKPISVVHRAASDENEAIFTIIFDKSGDDNIMNAITGFDRRSKPYYKKKLKGVKEISELGKLQNGSISDKIGDFGIVAQNLGDRLRAGDFMLLSINSSDALGDACTHEYDHMHGWIVRTGDVFEVEVSAAFLRWGKLSEKIKSIEDL